MNLCIHALKHSQASRCITVMVLEVTLYLVFGKLGPFTLSQQPSTHLVLSSLGCLFPQCVQRRSML